MTVSSSGSPSASVPTPAALSSSIGRIRLAALVILIAGIGLSVAEGVWAVAVGLGVSGGLVLGPLVSYIKSKTKLRADRPQPPTRGTMITMAVLGSLPPLILGGAGLAALSRHWWVGFPAGWFLGFGFSVLAVYIGIINGLGQKES
jgi:hypothetical protein